MRSARRRQFRQREAGLRREMRIDACAPSLRRTREKRYQGPNQLAGVHTWSTVSASFHGLQVLPGGQAGKSGSQTLNLLAPCTLTPQSTAQYVLKWGVTYGPATMQQR